LWRESLEDGLYQPSTALQVREAQLGNDVDFIGFWIGYAI
jgi:hypothetical protein